MVYFSQFHVFFWTCLFHWSCLWLHIHQHHWFFIGIWTFSGGWWASKATYCMWTLPDCDVDFCGIVILMFVALWFWCLWRCDFDVESVKYVTDHFVNMFLYQPWSTCQCTVEFQDHKEKNKLWIKLFGKTSHGVAGCSVSKNSWICAVRPWSTPKVETYPGPLGGRPQCGLLHSGEGRSLCGTLKKLSWHTHQPIRFAFQATSDSPKWGWHVPVAVSVLWTQPCGAERYASLSSGTHLSL